MTLEKWARHMQAVQKREETSSQLKKCPASLEIEREAKRFFIYALTKL